MIKGRKNLFATTKTQKKTLKYRFNLLEQIKQKAASKTHKKYFE